MKTDDGGSGNTILRWSKNIIFWVVFGAMAALSIVFLIVFYTHADKAKKDFVSIPVFKSRYTTVYGEPVKGNHATLFGSTDVLLNKGGSYMPFAPIPITFDFGLSTIDTNLTYFRCSDPDYQAALPAADRTRLVGVCQRERSSMVAMYRNDPTSLTFSSAWNPLFMSMVVLWLYASWALLLTDWGSWLTYKWMVYVFWQMIIFGVVLFSAPMQVDNAVIPRNNVIYSLVLILLTVAQQILTMYRCSQERAAQDNSEQKEPKLDVMPTMQMLYEAINLTGCVSELSKSLIPQGDTAAFQNYKLVQIVLNSQVLLFPTLVLTLYTLALHNSLEWVIQSVWVRMVLFIACLILVHYRKINPLNLKYDQLLDRDKQGPLGMARDYKDNNKYTGMVGRISNDSFLVIVGMLLVYGQMIVADIFLLRHTWEDPYSSVASLPSFICLLVGVGLLMLLNVFFKKDNVLLLYGNVLLFNGMVALLSIVVIYLIVNKYSNFYCSFGSTSKYFCGNAANHNLNVEEYTDPIKITGTTMSAVYTALQGSLTYAV